MEEGTLKSKEDREQCRGNNRGVTRGDAMLGEKVMRALPREGTKGSTTRGLIFQAGL